MSFANAIAKTIAYAARHRSTLTRDELIFRLISSRIHPSYSTLQNPQKFNHPKLTQARQLAGKLSSWPNILFIGVTGSIASHHPRPDDDIDLLIITRPNTLWLTRFSLWLFFIFHRLPHRHPGHSQRSGEFCPNIWLDQLALTLPSSRQTLQSAVDLILLIPVLNRHHTYEQFILANSWAKRHVATGYHLITKKFQIPDSCFRIPDSDSILNLIFFLFQYAYMKSKITTETISPHSAYFLKN